MGELVKLVTIWDSSYEEVKGALIASGFTPSHPQYDCALLALIYYNSGLLDPEDNWAVIHPDFLTIMGAATDLNAGLQQLLKPFTERLRLLYGYFGNVDGELTDLGNSDYWLYHDHMRDLSGIHSYPWDALRTELGDNLYLIDMSQSRDDLYERQGELNIPTHGPPGATRAQEIRMTELIWVHFLSYEILHREEVRTEEPIDVIYNPYHIIDAYLNVNMTYVHPLVKCFYWYSVWELSELFPRIDASEQILANLAACGDLIVTDIPSDVLPATFISDLIPLAQTYMGPPDRHTFISRLIKQFDAGLIYDTALLRDLDIFDRILLVQGYRVGRPRDESDQANYIVYTRDILADPAIPWIKEYYSRRPLIHLPDADPSKVRKYVFDVYGRDRSEEFGLPGWPGK